MLSIQDGGRRPIKSKLRLEGFSCKTELPIRHDFCAAAYMGSLASADCQQTEEARIGKIN
jgi:hypothetical protein